ncbi:RHS repeat domain-containing protein [Streptomyces carpinensis]|uniref:RHS repeat-associated core domain-containing protein n=1 Tax=Streptomyces carpinensis TaxID=66369 RepID=A0ABV1VXE5_9ACTN|nr:RHS repeat-associated core domain-containing protein [Streptomyces carpinensis]
MDQGFFELAVDAESLQGRGEVAGGPGGPELARRPEFDGRLLGDQQVWVDPAWGTATKTTDANGNVTEWAFDALGRLKSVWNPDRSRTLSDAASIAYAYSINNNKETWVRTDTLKADGQTYNSSYEIFDSLLRTRQKQVPAPNGGRVISETLYDDRGLPYITNDQVHDNNAPSGTLANTYPGSVPASTETVFDAAGRATESIFRVYDQEKWRTKTDELGDRTAVTAAAGGTGTLTMVDARGRITERREYGGPVPTGSDYTRTLYEYTPGGQLKKMTGPDGAVWTYDYDLRGRKITTTDPDKGRVDTTYNDVDQPLTVTTTLNGASRTLITDYDELGRKTGTWDGVKDDAHQLTKFTYDSLAKGQPTASIRYVGGTTGKIYSQSVTGYDALGRPKGTKTVIAATDPLVTAGAPQTFTTSTTYNIDGTVQSTSMPAVASLPAETVTNTYNDLGMLTGTDGMTDYVQNIGYSPYGEIEETRLGTSTGAKQLQILNRYEDGTRRLSNSHTVDQTNTGYTRDANYTYDTSGNITSITDNAGGKDTQCFAYDGYRRLTEAWTPSSNNCTTARSASALGGPAPYWTSWTYKSGGLRDTQTEHKATGDTKTTYGYPAVNASGSGQPHTLTSVTVGTGTAKPYTYDEQGNTTKRYDPTGVAQSLTWDIEGELTHLTEGTKTTDYLYDAGGDLLIRRGPAETVLYLAGQELHYDTVAKKFTAQRYYPAGDATAVRTEAGLTWMVDDHYGTASMAVDPTTQAITRRYTKPFGEARGIAPSTWPDDKGFLGKPADTDTGLTHIGAREYDPATGRFLSADPVLALNDHESLNGYAYANNTPVTLADPTGLRPDGACGGASSSCNGGTETWTKTRTGWHWSYTKTYTQQGTFHGVSGTFSTVVTTDPEQHKGQDHLQKGSRTRPCEEERVRSLGRFERPLQVRRRSLYGIISNIPHAAEQAGWIWDSDCRGDGGPGAPGCDYGDQFDNWIAEEGGYDTTSDTYQVPTALAAIFGMSEGGLPKPGRGSGPTARELLARGAAPDKNNFSRAGFELQKNANRSSNAGQWPTPSGKKSPWAWSDLGQETLARILNDPRAAVQSYTNKAGDNIIEYHVPWGGVQFRQFGGSGDWKLCSFRD